MNRFFILILFVVIFVCGVFLWWENGTTPVDPADQTKQTFIVSQGEGVRTIAQQLKLLGLIKDPTIFSLLVKQLGLQDKMQAGEFHISPSMSAIQIAQALQVGAFDLSVTIPEGKRAEEIADILTNKLPHFTASWREKLDSYEGYLFPDTYSFTKDTTIAEVIQTMTDNFNQKYARMPQGRRSTLSKQDIVTIASIVEREAKYPEDRPLVASVIMNRLRLHMALQVDATVQYALGYQATEKSWWKKELTLDDLRVVSFYNTYLNTGLPPGPICNPGLDALTAVENVPDTNYVFYVSDKTGHNHFEVTSEQHNADIVKYGI